MSPDTPAVREHTRPIEVDRAATTGTDSLGPESVCVPPDTMSGLLGGGGAGGPGPRVVGLGEATHGTRECFLLKTGLVRELVEHHGIRTLAMEADVTETRALDAFVRQDVGGPTAALCELHKWMWQVESIRDLLVWLRSFNRTRPADDQVRVRGLDLSHPAAPVTPLRSYLETVDPEYAEQSNALSRLATFAGETVPEDAGAREDLLGRVERAVATVADRLDDERARYVGAAAEDPVGGGTTPVSGGPADLRVAPGASRTARSPRGGDAAARPRDGGERRLVCPA
ncbi:MAG: erythromycin esterase related protein [halophilic archaeon J07HX64]|jgi:Erythromycin esterase homolog|nr:MAG: erythromycin esterase related protein [halophilic archaeon J07HX64]